MDQSTPLTKRELKHLRRLEKLDQEKQAGSRNTIRWIMLGVGAFLFIAFFGSLIFLAKQSSQKPVALSDNGWVRGEVSAKVTLSEFGDFQCPACKTYYPMIQGLLVTYKDRSFRLIFKHFPLTSAHKNAFGAAMAAEAAGAQGKFFEMHDILYERQDEWARVPVIEAQERFISYAAELRLEQEKFLKDLASKEFEEKIRANQDEGINNGVSGTPTFFLNGKIIQNPRSVDDFKKLIDEELK
ncbi:MAG: DsbA family protein [Candidatus Levybacteria bacterium]|nr:DsbA family protein [Candidatus Levybacteria bacterium]